MPWDDAPPGTRASRPHNTWHTLSHLLHMVRPAAPAWLFVRLAVGNPADLATAYRVALKRSACQAANAAGYLQRRRALPTEAG